MKSGLEVFLSEHAATYRGARVGLCCNHTAVDSSYRHAIDRLLATDVPLVRLFGPEHGVRATAQDMEGVGERRDPVTGVPTLSLYGDDEASLHPPDATLADLDVVLFDIQDIGARYYTYQATLGFLMQVAARTNTKIVVLDRPNPIDGVTLEGNVVRPGFESFVGAFPIATRHAMTVGELAHYFLRHCDIDVELEVIACEGWRRDQWFDATGQPWVYPSPNMPTLETATIYPGLCLIEATNLSEGRGTTRPFHLVGAPWIDPQAMTAECERRAAEVDLQGVAFRPAAFVPGFQKHARTPCQGIEIHLTDRHRLHALKAGMVVLEAARAVDPERFGWRAEPYEFIDDVPAIDLLIGNAEYREAIESGTPGPSLLEQWKPELDAFAERRAGCLLY